MHRSSAKKDVVLETKRCKKRRQCDIATIRRKHKKLEKDNDYAFSLFVGFRQL